MPIRNYPSEGTGHFLRALRQHRYMIPEMSNCRVAETTKSSVGTIGVNIGEGCVRLVVGGSGVSRHTSTWAFLF